MYIPRSKLECPKTQTPLTNGVRGPYCKLRAEFFPIDLWPKRKVRGPYMEGNKRGSVTYSTDRENEVSKIYYISTLCLTGSGTISIHEKASNYRCISKAKQVNLKSLLIESLAGFNTKFQK